MSTLFGRDREDWIADYARSHRHPVNRFCHTLGIPMIVVSLPCLLAGIWVMPLLLAGAVLFAVGWVLQFVGHLFEGKPPEFFRDWRFLFVGVSWWLAKIRGREKTQ